MNENHSAITRLMYQLFISLGKKSVSTELVAFAHATQAFN